MIDIPNLLKHLKAVGDNKRKRDKRSGYYQTLEHRAHNAITHLFRRVDSLKADISRQAEHHREDVKAYRAAVAVLFALSFVLFLFLLQPLM